MPHSVFITGMDSNHSIQVIRQLFIDFNIVPQDVLPGEVIVESELTSEEIYLIDKELQKSGFKVIHHNRLKIATKIKSLLIDLIETDTFDLKLKLSGYISSKLNYEYHYLSSLFSEMEGTTIEKYFIRLKIERVMKLIDAGNDGLAEIADKLGYSSQAHLTNQFKTITGFTPTHYKSLKTKGNE
ncbi:MAG: AraC family transcriptional regulator [Bacteroidota bacterium]|nr:AraC family transcriptional regulator [Bacteroidota bacterium]